MKDDENSIQARITRGNLALQAGESEQARQYFLKAQQVFPKAAEPSIALGQLALVKNDRAEAKTQFQTAVRLAPDSAQALQGLLTVQERDETEQFMRTVLESHPDATGPRLILLEIALLGNNTEEADQLTASLLERSDEATPAPSSEMVAGIYGNAAANLRQSGETEKSDLLLERAQVLFPDNERINLLAARQAFDRGNIEAAKNFSKTPENSTLCPRTPTSLRLNISNVKLIMRKPLSVIRRHWPRNPTRRSLPAMSGICSAQEKLRRHLHS